MSDSATSGAGSSTKRSCAHHPEFEAIAVCSLCGRDICARCHAVVLTGYAVCLHCPVREKLRPRAAIEARELANPLAAGVRSAVEVIKSPRRFFSKIPLSQRWFNPFVFGYTCIVLGTGFATLWQYLFVDEFGQFMRSLTAKWSLAEPAVTFLVFASVAPVAFLLFGIHSILLYISLQLFGAQGARFDHVVRIVGFASAAHLFQIIPPVFGVPVGHFLTIVWLFNIEIVAVQRYFEMNFMRALAAVFVPYLFTALFSV